MLFKEKEQLYQREKILLFPEKGLRAAKYRLIGNTPDAQASAILLCESRNPSQWAGIIGRIYALRGWKESFNISWMIDVVCTQSYADNKIFNVGAKIGTGQASIQAGTCEYQGKTYLALSVGSDSTMTLFFTVSILKAKLRTQLLKTEN